MHFVDQMDEVLTIALESPLQALITPGPEVLASVSPTELTSNAPAPQ